MEGGNNKDAYYKEIWSSLKEFSEISWSLIEPKMLTATSWALNDGDKFKIEFCGYFLLDTQGWGLDWLGFSFD